jgi:hypothetical protein
MRLVMVLALTAAGIVGCSSSDGADGGANDSTTATAADGAGDGAIDVPVTLGELDDVVITVAPEDLSGEVIVIGEGSTPPGSAAAPSESSAQGTIAEPEDAAPELNPLGGDDPEDQLMPDVVCMDLQAAQDEIQDHGVFFSKSVDATGEGRRQIFDRNWIVVEQSPAAGQPIGENEAVLSVVKDDEPSNC